MAIAWQSYVIEGKPPRAVVPRGLLKDVRLSELPDDIAVKPTGAAPAPGAGEDVECWLYTFRDGCACARIRIIPKQGLSVGLLALWEAVRERQEQQDDVELTDPAPEDCEVSFLLDLREDTPILEALERVAQALRELNARRAELLAATQWLRRSAAP